MYGKLVKKDRAAWGLRGLYGGPGEEKFAFGTLLAV
jgi:hypothetical protein